MFNGTNLTLSSEMDKGTSMFGLHERSLTYRCIISKYMSGIFLQFWEEALGPFRLGKLAR